ncbi:MAG TPA: N-acetylmuramoyl-L-alanine amidase [Longimicrobiaceae bacterium]|nr:N-acetylmuramoyl-L-alanine amidase [Longimicrobiaceae bacterium]
MRTRFPEILGSLLVGLLFAASAHAQGSARPLVVVDAGHGGVDPGARGPAGTLEKDVTLAVARDVADILRDSGDLEVRLTRDRDTLIALHDRPALANRWRGPTGTARPALFLSIHANANRDDSARGFETFFLSEAKTEDARRVAEMENSAERYETDAPRQDDALSFILNDLRQNHYLRASDRWAEMIQDRLDPVEPGPDRGVKQAGFVVLTGTFMPAVLVEIGFITNPAEEQVLADPAWQRRVARQLARAVHDYLSASAPSADRGR